MGGDNGPLYAYEILHKEISRFQLQVIYNISNVYTVFLINLMLFQKQGHF
jgi:hypothetical protein